LSVALALPGFEAALRLIDDVNAAFAAYDPVVAVTAAKRFQGITNFHGAIRRYWLAVRF
jgi:hypothetical protein